MLEYGTPIQQIMDMVRTQISDDAHLYTDSFLLSAINSAIHILAMEEDLQRLFRLKYKAELEDVYSMKEALTETVTNQNQTISELNQKLNSCEVQLKN